MSDSTYEPPGTKPDEEYVITDLETLRVMADPLRLQILDTMLDQVCTVKHIAAELNIPPTKLYYHFKQLEEHSLIRVVDTRLVSGIVEKLYQVRAYSYRVDKGLLSPGTPEGDKHLNQMLSAVFDEPREDIRRSIEAGVINLSKSEPGDDSDHRSLTLGRFYTRMSPERAKDFTARLKALVKEFNDDDADEQAYAFVIALYPSVRHHSKSAGDDSQE